HLVVWQTLGPAAAADDQREPEQVSGSRQNDYQFTTPGAAWHAVRRPLSRRRFSVVAVDTDVRSVPAADLELPEGFLAAHPCRRLIGASLPVSEEWAGYLLVCEPRRGVRREQNARFALQFAQQVGPAMYDY